MVTKTLCSVNRKCGAVTLLLPRFSKGVSNDIYGGLSLGLGLLVKRDVGHLLARVEEGVLGT